MAAAAVSAGTAALQVFLGGNVPKLESLIDQLVNTFLHLVHFLLGVDEGPRDGIVQQRLALGLKCGYFLSVKGESLMLFFVQRTAFFAQALVKFLGARVRHKSIHPLADILKLGLLHDGFTQFQGLLAHSVFDLSRCLHDVNLPMVCGKCNWIHWD